MQQVNLRAPLEGMYEGLVISAVKYANQGQKKIKPALKTRKKPPVFD